MTREEAIAQATGWLDHHGHDFGTLRYARYMWDFRSGLDLACDRLAWQFFFLPSPFGSGIHLPNCFRLNHGWLVVFDPPDQPAENPEQTIVLWVDEVRGSVEGRVPD